MSSVNSEAAESHHAELIRDLSLAWKNLAAYPPQHPALKSAVEKAKSRLAEYLGAHGRLDIGVTREALLIGEERLVSPNAQRLAEALYRRDVAILRFAPGLAPEELETLLRLLAPDPHLDEKPPLWDRLEAAAVQHVEVVPVDYSAVVVTEDATPAAAESSAGTLWESILRELMAGQRLAPFGLEVPEAVSPTFNEVSALIARLLAEMEEADENGETPGAAEGAAGLLPDGEGGGGEAADGRGEGAAERAGAELAARWQAAGADAGTAAGSPKTQVASALSRAVAAWLMRQEGSPAEAGSRAQQVARLLKALPRELRLIVLDSALRQLAPEERARPAIQTLVASLPSAEVLASFERLRAERIRFSSHATRLLQTLLEAARDEGTAEAPLTPEEEEEALAQLRQVFREEDIDRGSAGPEEARYHRTVLELPRLAVDYTPPAPISAGAFREFSDPALAERLARSLAEMLAAGQAPRESWRPMLARLEGLIRGFLVGRSLKQAVELLEGLVHLREGEEAEDGLRQEVAASLDRLAGAEARGDLVQVLLEIPDPTAEIPRRLVAALGSGAIRALLESLCTSEERARRRQLLDVLIALGGRVAPEARRLLADPRWFAQRNMILLLRRIGDRGSLPEIRRLAGHADPRVRLEAVKTLFAFGTPGAREILEQAIHDPDPKLAEAAVVLSGSYAIAEAARPLADLLGKWDPLGRRRSLRLKALRALAELGDGSMLPRLRHFFSPWRWPPVAAEERRTAFESLRHYPKVPRRPLVERGMRSRDPMVRRVCQELAAQDQAEAAGGAS